MYEIVKERNLLIKKKKPHILLSADENVNQLELSYTGGGNVNTEQPLWNSLEDTYKVKHPAFT